MARPANKPATTSEPRTPESFNLPAPFSDPQLELFYYLGHLRGRIATADRITELVLQRETYWQAKLAEAERGE